MDARKLKRVVLSEEIFALTEDTFEAIILNQFIYWQERVLDFDLFIKEERQRAELNDKPLNIEETNGWIYKKTLDLKDECMLNVSEQTMRKYIRNLINKGFLYSRTNPKYKWDKTFQYRVDIIYVIKKIREKGYNGLTGWFDRISDFKGSSDKNGSSNDNYGCSSDKNGGAIPDTTNIDYNTDKEEIKKLKESSNRKMVMSEDVEYLYSLYPAKCPKRNTSTGKSYKDKEKIKKLLETKSKEELEFIIKSYSEECINNGSYLKNFSTMLNNLPDASSFEKAPIREAQTSKYR